MYTPTQPYSLLETRAAMSDESSSTDLARAWESIPELRRLAQQHKLVPRPIDQTNDSPVPNQNEIPDFSCVYIRCSLSRRIASTEIRWSRMRS